MERKQKFKEKINTVSEPHMICYYLAWHAMECINVILLLLNVPATDAFNTTWLQFDGIPPKGTYPPCLSMADRALLAGYPRIVNDLYNKKEENMSCVHNSWDVLAITRLRTHWSLENVVILNVKYLNTHYRLSSSTFLVKLLSWELPKHLTDI